MLVIMSTIASFNKSLLLWAAAIAQDVKSGGLEGRMLEAT